VKQKKTLRLSDFARLKTQSLKKKNFVPLWQNLLQGTLNP